MLNLSFIFDDACTALTSYPDRVKVLPLPAAVYLMQMDVLNHYNHALAYNFTISLNAPSLQNSSRGTPYQKWASIVNENFSALTFAVHNLLRYTGRLVHDAGCMMTVGQGATSREYWAKSNSYTSRIFESRYQTIGITVTDNHQLTITRPRIHPHPHPVIMRGVRGGPAVYVRVVKDAAGREREEPTDGEEFDRSVASITTETIDIRDRSNLAAIRDKSMAEVAALAESNRAFGSACKAFYALHQVAEPYSYLIESDLI